MDSLPGSPGMVPNYVTEPSSGGIMFKHALHTWTLASHLHRHIENGVGQKPPKVVDVVLPLQIRIQRRSACTLKHPSENKETPTVASETPRPLRKSAPDCPS